MHDILNNTPNEYALSREAYICNILKNIAGFYSLRRLHYIDRYVAKLTNGCSCDSSDEVHNTTLSQKSEIMTLINEIDDSWILKQIIRCIKNITS